MLERTSGHPIEFWSVFTEQLHLQERVGESDKDNLIGDKIEVGRVKSGQIPEELCLAMALFDGFAQVIPATQKGGVLGVGGGDQTPGGLIGLLG